MRIKKPIAALLAPVILILSACSGSGDGNPDSSSNILPSEVVEAVLDEIPITSAVKKDKDDIADYYPDIDISEVESACFCLCGSGALPDEIAVIKFTSASAASDGKSAFEKRLSSQKELFLTYTPNEMYKLETAQIYTKGNFAVFLAVSDNETAKSIVNKKLS